MGKIKYRFLENYNVFISLLGLSGMLLYVPFTANEQAINFISIGNNEMTTEASKHIALMDTIIFYPILFLLIISIFALTILKIKGKKILHYDRWLTYLALGVTVTGAIGQYSKILYGPYLLLFLVLFFKKQLTKCWQKIKPIVLKWSKAKWIRWLASHLKWTKKLLPHLCYWLIVFINVIWIFKSNLGQRAIDITKIRLFWINVLLILLVFYGLRGITRRFWGPALFTSVFFNLFYLCDIVMDKMRNDAIVPSQLTMLRSVRSLASMVSPMILITIGACIIAVIYLSRLLADLYPIPKPRWYQQVLTLVLAVSAYSTTFFWNQPKLPVATFMTNRLYDNRQFYNQAWGAKINGPWIQFLNNVDIQVMKKPNGYSKATMQQVAKRYQHLSQQMNASRPNHLNDFTVVYNLSESFADPKRVPTVSYSGKPIRHIRAIQKQSATSGLMMSSGYGGGTANMEYMTLTSMPTTNLEPTLATPYTQIVPYHKHDYSVANGFSHTTAIHTYNNSMYDRSTDYPKLGIHSFYNIDNKKHPIKHQHLIENNPYLSDQTAYRNVEDQLKRCQQPQFINLITMQNHVPWNDKYEHTSKWNANAGYGTDENVLAQYIQGINYTDQAVQHFYENINNNPRPIVWVFYGDHLPGLYQNPMKKDGLKLHQTDYFIYLNPAARAKVGDNYQANKVVDPNEFTAQVLNITNSKVKPFQALQVQALAKLPVKVMHTNINTTNQYSGNLQWINPKNGKIIDHPKFNQKQKKLWHDYTLIQYDQCAGKHYLPASFFK